MARPPYLSLHETRFSRDVVESALRGEFSIRGGPVVLRPPINWRQNPYNDRSWCFWLHSLIALEPLLREYHKNDRIEALIVAADIALDWVNQHPNQSRNASSSRALLWHYILRSLKSANRIVQKLINPQRQINSNAKYTNNFAWYDMAVATRGCYMAYLWRVGSQTTILSPRSKELLRESCVSHARWLADNSNYEYANNHGLYQDAALFIIACQLQDHPESADWCQLARERYRQNIASTIAEHDAVHLEHSPGYHCLIINLLVRFQAIGLRGSSIDQLVDRMRESARWFITPTGCLAQLGDTDLKLGPKWARNRPPYGLQLFRQAGYAIVREDDSYLAMTAGYHSRFHKHNDELSFVLYEGGSPLVVDSGRYGYYYGESGRLYAISQRAHNGVVFDHRELDYSKATPYGSGVVGGGQACGWYVIEGINPIAQELQGIAHRRLFLYQPGSRLLIVDSFQKPVGLTPAATQFLHFAPGTRVCETEYDSLYVEADKAAARISCLGCGPDCSVKVIEGQVEPEIQGWTFPRNREWVRAPTIALHHGKPANVVVTSMEFSSECQRKRRLVRILYDGELFFEEAGLNSVSDAPCDTFSIIHDDRGTRLYVS